MAGKRDRLDIGDHVLRLGEAMKLPLTNLDKVLYPEAGITKGQLIAYDAVVAEWILPHLAGRPLTLVRCPDGHHRQCFFQKHVFAGVPEVIDRIEIAEKKGSGTYMMVGDLAGLVALAQLGVLEIHTWGCHGDQLERPDQLIIDLDPDPALPWQQVAGAAVQVRARLAELGLTSFVKTTGGKGLHVVAPVERRTGWDELEACALALVEELAAEHPDRFVTNPLKVKRKGKLFLDYLRNGRGATAVAPYSTRARPGAPVATPITWEELAAGVDPADFTLATVPRRLAELPADPWAGYFEVRQSIKAPRSRRATAGARRPGRRPARRT